MSKSALPLSNGTKSHLSPHAQSTILNFSQTCNPCILLYFFVRLRRICPNSNPINQINHNSFKKRIDYNYYQYHHHDSQQTSSNRHFKGSGGRSVDSKATSSGRLSGRLGGAAGIGSGGSRLVAASVVAVLSKPPKPVVVPMGAAAGLP